MSSRSSRSSSRSAAREAARRGSRTSERRQRADAVVTDASPCPCGLGAAYGECCGKLHAGQRAATAEALMRSRYSAFVVRNEAYLLRTWHPTTRPQRLGLDDGTRWTGLEIVETTQGSAFHATGTVTFRAYCTERGRPGVMVERSRFVRHDGAWVYVDGEVSEG